MNRKSSHSARFFKKRGGFHPDFDRQQNITPDEQEAANEDGELPFLGSGSRDVDLRQVLNQQRMSLPTLAPGLSKVEDHARPASTTVRLSIGGGKPKMNRPRPVQPGLTGQTLPSNPDVSHDNFRDLDFPVEHRPTGAQHFAGEPLQGFSADTGYNELSDDEIEWKIYGAGSNREVGTRPSTDRFDQLFDKPNNQDPIYEEMSPQLLERTSNVWERTVHSEAERPFSPGSLESYSPSRPTRSSPGHRESQNIGFDGGQNERDIPHLMQNVSDHRHVLKGSMHDTFSSQRTQSRHLPLKTPDQYDARQTVDMQRDRLSKEEIRRHLIGSPVLSFARSSEALPVDAGYKAQASVNELSQTATREISRSRSPLLTDGLLSPLLNKGRQPLDRFHGTDMSPARSRSPHLRSISPGDLSPPPQEDLAFRVRSLSPRHQPSKNRSPSPHYEGQSSRKRRNRSPSPHHESSLSRRRSRSPRYRDSHRRSVSPMRRSPSPRRRDSSTRHRSPSPRYRTSYTRHRSPLGSRRSASPRRGDLRSRRRSPSPQRRSPVQRRRSPSTRRRRSPLSRRSPSPAYHRYSDRRRSSWDRGRSRDKNSLSKSSLSDMSDFEGKRRERSIEKYAALSLPREKRLSSGDRYRRRRSRSSDALSDLSRSSSSLDSEDGEPPAIAKPKIDMSTYRSAAQTFEPDPRKEPVSAVSPPTTKPDYKSFLSKVLEIIQPNSSTAAQVSAVSAPTTKVKSSSSKSSPDVLGYDPTKPSFMAPTPPKISYNAFCPICSDQLNTVQRLPRANMIQLKEHVLSFHLPWYIAVGRYETTNTDGTDFRRSQLSDQLHPIIFHSVESLTLLPAFYTQLWGKLLQGFLKHLTRKLDLRSPYELESIVVKQSLFPAPNIISDVRLILENEEKIMMNAHQAFINDGMRLLEVSPPNCLSSILHWITLVNIICKLPKEERAAIATYSAYTESDVYEIDKDAIQLSTFNQSTVAKLWNSIEKSLYRDLFNVLTRHPDVLNEKHSTGVSPIQYALDKKAFIAARTMLIHGANPETKDKKGWTPLCRCAYYGNTEGVQILLAWGAHEQLQKALAIAMGEGHTRIVNLLEKHLVRVSGPGAKKTFDAINAAAMKAKSDAAKAEANAWRCDICNKQVSGDQSRKGHFVHEHLPWYLAISRSKPCDSILYKLLRPALQGYVRVKQMPFEFFAKLWGKLLHDFLTHLSSYLRLNSPADLVWYVTSQNLIPTEQIEPTNVEAIMMRCHKAYIEEHGVPLQLCPPNCRSAILHWETLYKLFNLLSKADQERLETLESFSDVRSLKEGVYPYGYQATMCQSTTILKQEFWHHIENGDLGKLWTIILQNEEFVFLYGSSNSHPSPLQCALSRGHSNAARLLLFYGAPTGRKDDKGRTPLCSLAYEGNLQAVSLLLAWVHSRSDKEEAMYLADLLDHKRVTKLIQKALADDDISETKKKIDDLSGRDSRKRSTDEKDSSRQDKKRRGMEANYPATVSLPHYQYPASSGYLPQPPPVPMYPIRPGYGPPRPPWGMVPPPYVGPYMGPPGPFPGPFPGPPYGPIYRGPVPPPPHVTGPVPTNPSKSDKKSSSKKSVPPPIAPGTEDKTVGLKDKRGNSFMCTFCTNKEDGLDLMRRHVVICHLPWYFGLKYQNHALFKSTKLAEKFLPVIGPSFLDPSKVPFGLFFKLLGKLLHGLLTLLTKHLGLQSPSQILKYVNKHNHYPSKSTNITEDEKLLIRAHRDYLGDKTSAITISPPNCLSAVLHWETIINLVRKINKKAQKDLVFFERYSADNIIEKNSKEKPNDDTIKRIQIAIRDDKMMDVWKLLNQSPLLASALFDHLGGLTALEYALSMNNIDAATMLLFYGAGVDRVNRAGWTALKTFASKGHLEIVKFLRTWEASAQLKEAYEDANRQDHKKVCEYLKKLMDEEAIKTKKEGATIVKGKTNRVLRSVKMNTVYEKAADRKKCPVCDIGAIEIGHVTKHHLPWYAGLQGEVDLKSDTPPKSSLGFRLLSGIDLGTIEKLPDCVLSVLGKLMYDMLNYMCSSLGLQSVDDLLKFVLDNKLWAKISEDKSDKESKLLQSHIIFAYQNFTGTKEKVTLSPPDRPAALLHWETLFNIIVRLPKASQRNLITLETYTWIKDFPILPHLRGDTTMSDKITQAAEVDEDTKELFIKRIREGQLDKVEHMLGLKPGLAKIQIGPFMCGIVAYVAVFSPETSLQTRALLLKLLMLSGVNIDATDQKGMTALHHAVGRDDLFAVTSLLLWDADFHISSIGRKSPLQMAARKPSCLAAFHFAQKNALKGIANLASSERLRANKAKSMEKYKGDENADYSDAAEKCVLCNIEDAGLAHILVNHLPWYAGLEEPVSPASPDSRKTKLWMKFFAEMSFDEVEEKAPCKPFMMIIGSLLHGLLDWFTKELKLSSHASLLKYVQSCKICSKPPEGLNFVHDKILVQSYIMIKGEKMTPAQIADLSSLLYHKTLINILAKLPKAVRDIVVTYESFDWDKSSPRLPTAKGLITQPACEVKDTSKVSEDVQTAFLGLVSAGAADKCSELLQKYPELVYVRAPTNKRGIVAHAMVCQPSRAQWETIKVLVLSGADIDAADGNGRTALHHSVMWNRPQSVAQLLLCGASPGVKTQDGSTPLDVAKKLQQKNILDLFQLAETGNIEELCSSAMRERSEETSEVPTSVESIRNVQQQATQPESRQEKSNTDTLLMREFQEKDCDRQFDCPICKTSTTSARAHCIDKHFPWYFAVDSKFQHLITGNKKTKFSTIMSGSIVNAEKNTQNTRTKADIQARDSRFINLLGQLLVGFLEFLAKQLGLTSSKELVDYLAKQESTIVEDFGGLLWLDMFLMHALQDATADRNPYITVRPPNHISSVLHWSNLILLIAKLSPGKQEELLTFEKYSIPGSQCILKVIKTARGEEIKMSLPSTSTVPSPVKTGFVKAIEKNDISTICKILDQYPLLAYYPIPKLNNCSPIWYALTHSRYAQLPVLYLYGASPDQFDSLGMSPLHHAVMKGDLKAVQLLLPLNAKVDLKNVEGKTALTIAKEKKLGKIVAYLEESQKEVQQKIVAVEETPELLDLTDDDEKETKKKEAKPDVQNTDPNVSPNLIKTNNLCPVCQVYCEELREHAASHLPWYACLVVDSPVGKDSSRLCAMLHPILTEYVYEKKLCPAVCFLRVWGELISALITYCCDELNIKTNQQLLSYMSDKNLWPPSSSQITPTDKFASDALQTYLEIPVTDFTLEPPQTIQCLAQWRSLLNLVSTLPVDKLYSVSTFEKYQLKAPECKFQPVKKVGMKMEMSSPSLKGIKKDILSKFASDVRSGDLDRMCKYLDEHPNLAYYTFAGAQHCGILKQTLERNDYRTSVAARLYGSDPNHRDYNGKTVLHHFAGKNMVKACETALLLGADPTLTLPDENITPLDLAKTKNSHKVATFLTDYLEKNKGVNKSEDTAPTTVSNGSKDGKKFKKKAAPASVKQKPTTATASGSGKIGKVSEQKKQPVKKEAKPTEPVQNLSKKPDPQKTKSPQKDEKDIEPDVSDEDIFSMDLDSFVVIESISGSEDEAQ